MASGMVTSLPFLVFSGPITDMVGHINVIIIGMVAYTVRMVGYSFLEVNIQNIQQCFIMNPLWLEPCVCVSI